MKAEILEEVKKEIEKMLAAGFIRPCRYAEWISSIVPVEKKDGRWRVAIDFRDLNRATPKDEYPMPVVETLINAAAGHKVLSFMDGNASYNQIFMAPEDIHKTALEYRDRLSTLCTNNVAEYEAVRKGMELLLEAGAEAVELFGDSKLVISQLTDEYKCESESLFPYWMECRELMTHFRYINFNWVPRSQNTDANDLAQMASGYKDIPTGQKFRCALEQDDWRADIFNYLKDSARGHLNG
ncbi:hypothetical protein QYE76_007264 [Lolium multiflorum]|uniref:RNase H type-1 domain-containing protein n=1 Tax=Lolium multiflorum TaxID=4521 RepID=A0AAD8RXG9_LOLMU|nr:hypothetical protein QYE76_007264 [Lolium multiflorum]